MEGHSKLFAVAVTSYAAPTRSALAVDGSGRRRLILRIETQHFLSAITFLSLADAKVWVAEVESVDYELPSNESKRRTCQIIEFDS